MNKVGAVITIIVAVSLVYLFLLIIIPNIVAPMAAAANATMDASSNMSLYPGTSGMMISTPWILFFVPAALGLAVVVFVLRSN